MSLQDIMTLQWWTDIFKIVSDFVKKYLIIIIIFGSVGLYLYLKYVAEKEDFAEKVLATGIGATLMKAFQFSGIFKDEAKKAIKEELDQLSSAFSVEAKKVAKEVLQGEDHQVAIARAVGMGMRSDILEHFDGVELYKLWTEASKQMYKKKFQNISNELHDIISKKYFPIDSSYYASDVDCEIRVSEFEEGYITTMEIAKGDYHADSDNEIIIPASAFYDVEDLANNKGWMEAIVTIYAGTKDKAHSSKPLFSRKWGKDEMYINEQEKKIEWNQKFPVNGSLVYHVVRIVNKKYPYKRNETKFYRFGSLTHKVTAVVSMPEQLRNKLSVDYVQLGTVVPFEPDPYEATLRVNTCLCLRYDGLVLPHQGFMFHFKESN